MIALAFDLDDTLLNSAKRIGEDTRRALNEWLAAEKHVLLATSRPIRAVREFVDDELIQGCHTVTLNGAVWQYGNGDPIAEARLGELAKHIVEHPTLARETQLSIEFYGQEFATNARLTAQELAVAQSATPDMVVPLRDIDYASVTKVAIDGLGRSLLHHVEWIQSLGGRPIPAMDGTFLNVVDPSIDKSTTLHRILSRMEIGPEELIAFGDDIPDLGMLDLAGIRVAMGNGKEEVKAVADYVIADCDSDAIGEFIREYR